MRSRDYIMAFKRNREETLCYIPTNQPTAVPGNTIINNDKVYEMHGVFGFMTQEVCNMGEGSKNTSYETENRK